MNPQHNHAPPSTPLATGFETASAQLRDALKKRQISVADHPSRQALDLRRIGRLYQSFMLTGGPGDLILVVRPNPPSHPENDGPQCWELEVSLEVVVRWDEVHPDRAQRLHADQAQAVADLGFVQEEVDFGHIPGDPESYWLSEWTRRVTCVDEAADLALALLEVQCCQFPDGDDWMNTLIPLSTDQVEALLAVGTPLEEGGPPQAVCPVVMATGDYYWIPPVTPRGSLRLVGPGSEMAASVSQTHHWYTCSLDGDILANGQGASLLDAMNTAERMARGLGATRSPTKEEEPCR